MWNIFIIDCISLYISSDFNGFSSINIINYKDNIEGHLQEVNLTKNRDNIIEDYMDKYKEEKPIKKDKKDKKLPMKNISKNKPTKTVSFQNSEPISILKKESVEEYDKAEADNINLTLESLGKLEQENQKHKKIGSSSISDLQNNFLKKKMEDEYSDPGSDIDLEQFEKSISED